MSHFSVVVCIDDPAKLEAVLEPFSEQLEVEPYRSYEDGGPASYWAVKHLREENGLNPDDATLTWAQVAEAYNARYGTDGDERIEVDEESRAYTVSTYNPQSKWDWWQIGGRWSGYFVKSTGIRCDQGRKGDLDLEALRDVKAAEARAQYAEFQSVVAGTPEAVPWRTYADNVSEGNGYTIDQARDEYHAQPRVRALRASEEFKWHDAEDIAEFAKPEGLFVETAKARAVPGYATLTADGRWMSPGRMGWFGMSTDEEGDRIGYWEAANAYIDSMPDDTYLIAVDCHI